jgi:V/A-type H+-transporting ATPase subunit I
VIVEMKHLTLLCLANESEESLKNLRELGCVHLDLSAASSADLSQARVNITEAEKALRILSSAKKGIIPSPASGEGFIRDEDIVNVNAIESLKNEGDSIKAILEVDALRQRLIDGASRLSRMIEMYEPFGDFDPALAMSLREKGFQIELAKVRKGVALNVEDGYVQSISDDGRFAYVAIVGRGEALKVNGGEYEVVPIPAERLSNSKARLSAATDKISACTCALASAEELGQKILAEKPSLVDAVEFAAAKDVIASQGEVAYVVGWIPFDKVDGLKAKAKDAGWAVVLRNPKEGEVPPTLIRPPKLFRPVTALFNALGIAPAYEESDVSVPFMCYFSIFFAMLVGDGGYGAIVFALTMFGWFKAGKNLMIRPWRVLMSVFSVATIAWGFLSNTWFGAGLPFATEWESVKWLADPSYKNMMFLCFTIGASHLIIARLWSGACILNDRKCLSQFGWAGILFFMYWVTNTIVGIFQVVPSWLYVVFAVSLVLVFGFTLKGNELKSRGIELGMLPLNIMSALGDIISYVRLFAVGLASVKVAQNFNDMALANDWPLIMKCTVSVLILLVGHALNFAMAALSILVHAVRLNTLEFSNHKGVSWAGYAFAPFKKRDKNKSKSN